MASAKSTFMASSRHSLLRGGLFAALFVTLTGCSHRTIPGTEIPDTDDTRAVVEVVKAYREALEQKNAERILSLLSEEFRDNAGTGTPSDDLYYRDMKDVLPKRLAQVDNLRANFNIRSINVEKDVAEVVYHFDTEYQLPEYKTRPVRNSDLQRMFLKKAGGTWKILSGI